MPACYPLAIATAPIPHTVILLLPVTSQGHPPPHPLPPPTPGTHWVHVHVLQHQGVGQISQGCGLPGGQCPSPPMQYCRWRAFARGAYSHPGLACRGGRGVAEGQRASHRPARKGRAGSHYPDSQGHHGSVAGCYVPAEWKEACTHAMCKGRGSMDAFIRYTVYTGNTISPNPRTLDEYAPRQNWSAIYIPYLCVYIPYTVYITSSVDI